MKRQELFTAFERGNVDPSALSREPQIELALRFAEFYERHGLIRRGIAPPLWDCCPNGSDCWRSAWASRPTDGPEDGGISLPWIGPDYRPGGVAVLGINFNDASGLARAFEIGAGDAEGLAAGRRAVNYGVKTYQTNFPYRSTRTAALLSDALDGRSVSDTEQPEELVAVLQRLIRFEAIKCSPRAGVSKPTDEMWKNCPPLLLKDELRLASPGAIAAFGANVRWALGLLDGFETRGEGDRLHWGTLRIDDRQVPLYMLDHPNARYSGWATGHAALASLLADQT